jgi:hypothetical protein
VKNINNNSNKKKSAKRFGELLYVTFIMLSFVLHLICIFLVRQSVLEISYFDNSSYISAVSTPFTLIVFYEIYRLALSFSKPIIYSIIIQFEVISLIYIRNVFKTFAGLDIDAVTQVKDFIVQILVVLIISISLFISVKFLTRLLDKHSDLVKKEPLWIKKIRKVLSITLIISVVATILFNFFYVTDVNLVEVFLNQLKLTAILKSIFTIMILVDVVNFILTFYYNDTYSEAFRHVVYIVSAIIIRLSITAQTPYDLLLAIIGVVPVVTITLIQAKYPHDC